MERCFAKQRRKEKYQLPRKMISWQIVLIYLSIDFHESISAKSTEKNNSMKAKLANSLLFISLFLFSKLQKLIYSVFCIFIIAKYWIVSIFCWPANFQIVILCQIKTFLFDSVELFFFSFFSFQVTKNDGVFWWDENWFVEFRIYQQKYITQFTLRRKINVQTNHFLWVSHDSYHFVEKYACLCIYQWQIQPNHFQRNFKKAFCAKLVFFKRTSVGLG